MTQKLHKYLWGIHLKKLNKLFPTREINAGWTETDNSICSKIYGMGITPTQCLTTTLTRNGAIRHLLENY